MSRPWQITISVSNGSLFASSARSCALVTGRRITKVPAAPMLTASRCFSCSANALGRKVLCPPTLTPLEKNHECHAFSCWRRLRRVERPRRREPCDVGGGQRLLHGEFVQYLLDTFWYRDRDKPRTRVKIVFARFVDDTHEVASGGIRILEDFVNLADLERAGVFAVMNADYNCFGSVICRVQESV